MLFPVAVMVSALFLQTAPASQTPPASAPGQPSSAGSEAGPTTLPTVNVAATPAEPTQTCRTEPVTGSRFGRRVCRSTAQTDEDRVNSREMLRQMQGARTPPVG